MTPTTAHTPAACYEASRHEFTVVCSCGHVAFGFSVRAAQRAHERHAYAAAE